ncbi:haloacid dehalogenase [Nocardioides sp. Soil797]|nr:haloacid dehalogenase [Nocardioides sp. Soil797]
MQPLVVGFDLDMTLIDTVPGFSATLVALGDELGVDFPVEQMTSKLGPPLAMMLEGHVPAERIPAVGDRFRELYPSTAISPIPVFPGAHESLAAVRRMGGRSIVVTGKFTPNAQLHVDHLGLQIDHLEGMVWGVGKAAILRETGATIYVGDHVHDVEGALAAGVTSVSVLTGGCGRDELEAAGTHVVLDDLTQFPEWLETHQSGHPGVPTNTRACEATGMA